MPAASLFLLKNCQYYRQNVSAFKRFMQCQSVTPHFLVAVPTHSHWIFFVFYVILSLRFCTISCNFRASDVRFRASVLFFKQSCFLYSSRIMLYKFTRISHLVKYLWIEMRLGWQSCNAGVEGPNYLYCGKKCRPTEQTLQIKNIENRIWQIIGGVKDSPMTK